MSYRGRTLGAGIFSAPSVPEGVKLLLFANVIVFLTSFLLQLSGFDGFLRYFPLIPAQVVTHFYVWQLVTYLFLHGGFGHIIWNMLALWMFGQELERSWGKRRFLEFYFFCGIGAGLCVIVLNYLVGHPYTSTIGSSGAIYGILMAYAVLFPTRTILWAFLIPIQVKYFVMIIGAVAFLSSLGGGNSGVSEFAHLGGLLFGYLFLKMPKHRSWEIAGPVQRQYQQWKLQRAKKKFQVYMRKQSSDREPWIH